MVIKLDKNNNFGFIRMARSYHKYENSPQR